MKQQKCIKWSLRDRDQIGHFGLLYSTTYNSQTNCLTGNSAVVRHGYVVSCA